MGLADELQATLSEALGKDDFVVRWRVGDELTVWVFREDTYHGKPALSLMGWGWARRGWLKDPLFRDVFAAVEIFAASRGYQKVVYEAMQQIIYPVEIKNIFAERPAKVGMPPGKVQKAGMSVKKFDTSFGARFGIDLTPKRTPTGNFVDRSKVVHHYEKPTKRKRKKKKR
jgi:hypothetical protein